MATAPVAAATAAAEVIAALTAVAGPCRNHNPPPPSRSSSPHKSGNHEPRSVLIAAAASRSRQWRRGELEIERRHMELDVAATWSGEDLIAAAGREPVMALSRPDPPPAAQQRSRCRRGGLSHSSGSGSDLPCHGGCRSGFPRHHNGGSGLPRRRGGWIRP
ncbi:hypothetical protein OsI_36673 [Oryza sativa Indica Group]|uniref:Uncharacterized protein n=1 Tax=Oryza sativa subsp. indica TaxID=39946 RepID=A2ZFW9_ORYSI|nr:hypothetical protein OsI_36673 [Oryza sativa Indica Group]